MEQDNLVIDGISCSKDMLPEIQELPGELQDVAEIVGVRKAIELSIRFQGLHVYFPKMLSLRTKLRNSAIREDFDAGMTSRRLATKYGLSVRQIFNILGSL